MAGSHFLKNVQIFHAIQQDTSQSPVAICVREKSFVEETSTNEILLSDLTRKRFGLRMVIIGWQIP